MPQYHICRFVFVCSHNPTASCSQVGESFSPAQKKVLLSIFPSDELKDLFHVASLDKLQRARPLKKNNLSNM